MVDALSLQVEPTESEFAPFKDDIAALQVHTIWLQRAVSKEERFTEEHQAEARKFRHEADELREEIEAMHTSITEQRAQIERYRDQEDAYARQRKEQDEEADRLRKYIVMMENEAKMHRASLAFKLEDALRQPRLEAEERAEAEAAKRAAEQGTQAFEVAKNEARMKDLEQMLDEKNAALKAQQERQAGNKILNALSLLQFKKRSDQHRDMLAEQRQEFEEQRQQQHIDYEEALAQQAEVIEKETEAQAMMIQRENDVIAVEVQKLQERLEREKKRTAAAARRANEREARATEAKREALKAEAEARTENAARRVERERELLQHLERPEADTVTVETPRAAFPVLGVLRHVEHQMNSLTGLDALGGLNAEIAALEAEMAKQQL